MLIKESNRAKIEAMIKAAEGRATMRTITFENIVDAIARIEKKLDIPKTKMTGIRADVDVNAQNFPNAYQYRAESTQFYMIRKASGWDLTEVTRYYTRRAGHQIQLVLTDEAKEAILERCADF